MSCFGWFKRRSETSNSSSGPRGGASAAASGPATTLSGSAVSTSRSDDSGGAAVRPVSKSGGSSSQSQHSISSLYEERGHGQLRAFEYEELQAATADFARAQKLGEGGFGSVYKGFVRAPDPKADRVAVAVKRLNQRSLQGHKQWLAEVQFLGVLEHPNLVKLLGYCAVDTERGAQRLLVYEYMPNKSLEDHLFSRLNPPLSWNRRLQIILGAAEGLTYLHDGVEVQVIYRDFKTSNILLDKDFRAKLSDFGLAREGPTGTNTHVSTAVVGTHGYAAPEYVQSGHLTAKSDVWSFGVVLYEILTGRRSLDRNKPASEQKLLEWVVQFPPDSRSFRMIMDPRLRGEYSVKAAREIAKLADRCLHKNAKERPSMSEVVEVLRRAVQAHGEPAGGGDQNRNGSGKGKRASAAGSRR